MAKPLGLDLASKKARKLSDYPYSEEYRARWNDNDMYHHVNNPVYGVLIDSVINSWLISKCGYSTSQSQQIGLVGNSYCDFFGSAQYPGMLHIGLRIVKMGKSSLTYECGIFQEGNDAVRAVGGFTQIWRERQDYKPLADGIPTHIREGLQPLLKGSEQDPALKSKL